MSEKVEHTEQKSKMYKIVISLVFQMNMIIRFRETFTLTETYINIKNLQNLIIHLYSN